MKKYLIIGVISLIVIIIISMSIYFINSNGKHECTCNHAISEVCECGPNCNCDHCQDKLIDN